MKDKFDRTKHAKELFTAKGFSKCDINDDIWFVRPDQYCVGFDSKKREIVVKENNLSSAESYSHIDISTLKAINAMVYELGWYKGE